jgi:anti-anti-sigma regulatory factor
VIGEMWSRETSPCHASALTLIAVLSRPQLNTTVCTVTGKLGTGTTPVLRDALVEARRDDNTHLIIDLSTLTSMDTDSVGLYTLLEARYRHSISGDGHLAVVVDANSQAISELHIVMLKVSFDLHHNLVDALHACASADTSNVHSTDEARLAIDRVAVV